MRKAFYYSDYQNYLGDMYRYYTMSGGDIPDWLNKANWCEFFYFRRLPDFSRGASIGTIKKLWDEFSQISIDHFSDLSDELRPFYKQIFDILDELNRKLLVDGDPQYVRNKQLTRAGGKLINDSSKQLPSFYDIQPPSNKFTNIPHNITFTDSRDSSEVKYCLSIEIFRRISWQTEQKKGSFEGYTFRSAPLVMDQLISILQWNNIRPYLHIDENEPDDSTYKDLSTVYVVADDIHCSLNLLKADADNPFLNTLKTIWNNYGQLLKVKNIDLPWFKMIECKY